VINHCARFYDLYNTHIANGTNREQVPLQSWITRIKDLCASVEEDYVFNHFKNAMDKHDKQLAALKKQGPTTLDLVIVICEQEKDFADKICKDHGFSLYIVKSPYDVRVEAFKKENPGFYERLDKAGKRQWLGGVSWSSFTKDEERVLSTEKNKSYAGIATAIYMREIFTHCVLQNVEAQSLDGPEEEVSEEELSS